MTSHYLKADGEKLASLVEAVQASLESQQESSQETEEFATKVAEVLAYLKEQVEATTVAQAGLEAILSAYQARYGQAAEKLEDVVRFKAILEEKERKLSFLEGELNQQAAEVRARLDELAGRQALAGKSLNELEEALNRIKRLKQASLERLQADRTKLERLLERFGPAEEPSRPAEAEPARLNLAPQTLHSIIDQVLAGLAPEAEQRREILSQVLESVRDQDLRQIIAEKLEAPQL